MEGLSMANPVEKRLVKRWFIVVPYYPARVLEEADNRLRYSQYPARGDPYTYTEVVDVLQVFNLRWLELGVWPPPDLEPWAQEAVKTRKGFYVLLDSGREDRFTLQEIRPNPMQILDREEEEDYRTFREEARLLFQEVVKNHGRVVPRSG
jgi:hypothetical protein